jgi:hypothetical protein
VEIAAYLLAIFMVGLGGLEPPTSPLSGWGPSQYVRLDLTIVYKGPEKKPLCAFRTIEGSIVTARTTAW